MLTHEIGCDDDENSEGDSDSKEYEERQIINQYGHLPQWQQRKFCEKFLFLGQTYKVGPRLSREKVRFLKSWENEF